MTRELFRREAIESRRPHMFAELPPQIGRGGVAALWVGSLMGISSLLAALLWPFSGSITTPAVVVMSHGLIEVKASQGGHLTSLFVTGGQEVRRGEHLFTIDQRTFREGGLESAANANREAGAEAYATQLAREERAVRLEAASKAVTELAASLELLMRERTIQEERAQLGEDQLGRLGPLVERGFISELEFGRRREEVLAASQQMVSLDRQIAEQRARLRQGRDDIRELRATDQRELAEAASRLVVLNQKHRDSDAAAVFTPLAPVDATVVGVRYATGEYVSAQATVVTLSRPSDETVIESLVPVRWADALHEGDRVSLRIEGSLHERMRLSGGTITSIERVMVPADPQASPVPVRENSYRVRVTAGPELQRLGVGQPVSVNLQTRRRSLLSLLFS